MRRTAGRVGSLIAAVALSTAMVFAAAAPAYAVSGGYELRRGQQLGPGEYIQDSWPGGKVYWLIMQSDDNLVLYKGDAAHNVSKVCWASNTANRGWNSAYVVYQNDGNFVMYDWLGYVYWASNSEGDGGSTVNINVNGQLWVGFKQMTGNC